MSHFQRFKGLKTTHKPAKSKQAFVAGEPCLYAGHYSTSCAHRSNETGACKICQEKHDNEPSMSLDMTKIVSKDQKRAVRFWSYVDILGWDDCWKYEGPVGQMGMRYFWRRPELTTPYTHHIHRIATWLAWGDFGNSGTQSLCGERRCCNPLHQLPLGTDVNIKDKFSNEYLNKQLEIIKEQVSAYILYRKEYETRADFAELLLPGESKYPDSEVFDPIDITPIQLAIQEVRNQLKNNQHVSQI